MGQYAPADGALLPDERDDRGGDGKLAAREAGAGRLWPRRGDRRCDDDPGPGAADC